MHSTGTGLGRLGLCAGLLTNRGGLRQSVGYSRTPQDPFNGGLMALNSGFGGILEGSWGVQVGELSS